MRQIIKFSLKILFLLTTTMSLYSTFELKTDNVVQFNFNVSAVSVLLKQIDYLTVHLMQNLDASNNNFIQFLLQQSICPLQIIVGPYSTTTKTTAIPALRAPQRHHSIVLYNSRDISNILSALSLTRSGILLCVLLDKPKLNELLDVAQSLWTKSRIFKIYYITTERILAYNPFMLRSNVSSREYGQLVDINFILTNDIFKNLNGYPLRTYIFDSVYSTVYGNAETKQITDATGPDSDVAELLSKKMNFTIVLQWPDDEFFGARLKNGSFDGAIGRMVREETDITITGFFLKDYLTRDIEFSVSVYMDELCCYVRKAKRIPQSILPLFAVDFDVWCFFLSTGFFSPFIWMGIRWLNLHLGSRIITYSRHSTIRSNFQYVRIMIDTWVVWVRVNIVHFPPFYSERIFVISLCLVSVIFGALFESSLATVFIRPLYHKDINTMKELDDANWKIYIKHAAIKDDLFYGHSSAVYQHLDNKLLLVSELEERLIDMMSKRGGFSAVTRASSLYLRDIRYFITKKTHKIPECPKNYHICFLYAKQSPFEKKINTLLLKFVEAGIIDRWIDAMKYKAKISIHKFPDYVAELGDKWKVLTFKDLQLAFYALTTGCILATFFFMSELLVSFIYVRWQKRK